MNSQEWNTFVGWFMPAALLLVLLAGAWWLVRLVSRWRRLRQGELDRFDPVDLPAPGRAARLTETIALAALALVIYALTATNTNTGGWLTHLDELAPRSAAVHLALAGVALAGLAMGAVMALLGRGTSAVIVTAAVLTGYGLALNGPGEWVEAAIEKAAPGEVPYTITLSETNVTGADLWVNGIYLGKTPVTTTLEAFRAEVPVWTEAPAADEAAPAVYQVKEYSRHGIWEREYLRWIPFELPEPSDRHAATYPGDQAGQTYYAQVKVGDQWGYGKPPGGRRWGSDEVANQLEVIFPQRDRRLEQLLDQARLADYRVGPAWFQAMETYDEDGWLAMRKAIDEEPGMMAVLDAWARWRYELDEVKDAAQAWEAFERIMAEADRQRQYITASVAGRAVELLVPRLDARRLASLAVSRLVQKGQYGWFWFHLNDRLQFGMRNHPEGLYLPVGTIGNTALVAGTVTTLPPSSYAVAHAVWQVDHWLDEQMPSQANTIERQVPAALMRRHYDSFDEQIVRMALALGGPDIERFLLRKARWADCRNPHWSDRLRGGLSGVNGWCVMAAGLRGPEAHAFRQRRWHDLLATADEIFEHQMGRHEPLPAFLFADLERGPRSMAMQYWPRFARIARQPRHSYEALAAQWRYLLRMEPLATVDMYVDAWRHFEANYTDTSNAFALLDQLPEKKARRLIDRLRAEVEKDVSRMAHGPAPQDQEQARRYLLNQLKDPSQRTKAAQARRILEKFREGKLSEEEHLHVAAWLAHEQPVPPLVMMLAQAQEPSLRRLAIDALQAHPTPEHQAALVELAKDPDPQVRRAARQAQVALGALAKVDPATLAAPQADP